MGPRPHKKLLVIMAIIIAALPSLASQTQRSFSSQNSSTSANAFQKYTISADGINATFIPYGARLTSLFVKDKNGRPQDVVLGYDDATEYARDSATVHTYFGAVVGRYANRIRNGTFTLPDNQTYHIPTNEHSGADTLHSGGPGGYDEQTWTVTAHTSNSITFSLHDASLSSFPGAVLTTATYTLLPSSLTIRLVSAALTAPTPIMLSAHNYWNLGAFTTPEAETILNNTLHMPYAKRWIATDGILVPTGEIRITKNTPLDFTSPKPIGRDIEDAEDFCGTGCTGFDNAVILDRPSPFATGEMRTDIADPGGPEVVLGSEVLRMWAPTTGIEMRLWTNMAGLQVYSCDGLNGTIAVKGSQQHGSFGGSGNRTKTFVPKYGCVVLETQDWIDGINHPEWGREQFQIFSPTTAPAVNYQRYSFSAHH